MERKDVPDERGKKCPICAESIKLEAIKCRFCGHEFDQAEIENNIKFIQEMDSQGKKQCPTCGRWDVHRAYIENGSMGDWCPHCKKSILSRSEKSSGKNNKSSICFIISISALLVGLLTPKILVSLPLLVAIIFGFVSLIRGESLKWLGMAASIFSIIILVSVQMEFNKITTNLSQIGTNIESSIGKEDNSYLPYLKIEKIDFKISYGGDHATFAARVKNNGDKIVSQLKANVEVCDKKQNIVHSATIIDFGDIYPGSVKEISTFTRIPRDSKACRIFLTEAHIKKVN